MENSHPNSFFQVIQVKSITVSDWDYHGFDGNHHSHPDHLIFLSMCQDERLDISTIIKLFESHSSMSEGKQNDI
jgi:hypothetical protein